MGEEGRTGVRAGPSDRDTLAPHRSVRHGGKADRDTRPQTTPAGFTASARRTNRKIEPRGALGTTDNMPPWASMIDRQIERPIPIPPDFVVNRGLNTRWASSALMPVPVSAIEII